MSDPESSNHGADASSPEGVPADTQPTTGAPKRKAGAAHRRRLIWAVLVVLIGAVVGASVGWTSQEVVYQSKGLIYIEPSMPTPADPEGRSVLPMFQGFVAGQVQLLQQSRTSEKAMLREVWQATGEPYGPTAVERFEALRTILHQTGTQHIEIHFTDSRPEVAQAGVKALIEAYLQLAREVNDADDRLEYARRQIEALTANVQATTRETLALTQEYGGVEALEIRHLAAVEQVLEAEKALQTLREEIARHSKRKDATPGEIALEDPLLAGYLLELDLLEAQAKLLAEKVDEHNEHLKKLRAEAEARERRIREYAEAWNRKRREKAEATLEQLKKAERDLEARLGVLRDGARKIGQTRAAVERLKAEQEDRTRQLDMLERLRDQLENQLQGSGRIKVYSAGSLPEEPYRDNRLLYAGIGGLLGGLAALALFLFFGFVARRMGRAADADAYHAEVRAAVSLLPSRIGEWKGRDVELPPGAARLPKPNVAIGREFMNPSTGENATLRIVQCRDARDLSAYYPPIQYPAEGWTLREAEPRHLPALLAAIPGTVYRFTRESADGSSEVLVYNFFARPDGSIESGPAGALNAAAETETQALGAAQFQILLGPTMTRDRRDEVFRTLIAAALPVMDALCVEDEEA